MLWNYVIFGKVWSIRTLKKNMTILHNVTIVLFTNFKCLWEKLTLSDPTISDFIDEVAPIA